MKILQVIHGYPPHYMAGSEVYTWNLCRQLAGSHRVFVFTRIENPYAEPYERAVSHEDGLTVWRINKPARDYTFRDKYLDPRMDKAFRDMLEETRPDVVHFGHLSHLSTQLPAIAHEEFGIPTVLTIHDFWMYCYRGQLVRPDASLCEGPTANRCLGCAGHFFKEWIDRDQIEAYQRHMRGVIEQIDLFLAPSHTVGSFFLDQGVAEHKVVYSPYGFDTQHIEPRRDARASGPLRIGFMGRIIPVKGIQILLQAFHAVQGEASLEIWGSGGSHEAWLNAQCDGDPRVHFRGGYHNGEIQATLDSMDVLVAPSLWLENSPLVIQEAMLAEVPVITSDAGGMAELVEDGKSGFLVPLGDVKALRKLLQRLTDEPGVLDTLETRRSSVRTIEDDAEACLGHYRSLASARHAPILPLRPAPRRVTLITNPGLCNLRCPMCDTHSPHASSAPGQLPLLSFDIVEHVVTQLAQQGLEEVIPSTMGEPLLYPEARRLLDLAARTGIRVNLTTNGTFPRGGVDDWAAALLPVVSDVKFSVNGIDPAVADKIMPGTASHRQLENIQRYLELKRQYEVRTGGTSTVTLQATFMEDNIEELPRLLRWAIANGFDRFKGHHLWVTWPQLQAQSLRRSAEAAARWNKMAEVLQSAADVESTPDGRKIQLANVVPILPDGLSSDPTVTHCPFLGREAWIEADGSFQVCCCPSSERAEFGLFGNVATTSFMDIWNSRAYRDFVSSWGHHSNCQRCNMRIPVQEVANA